MISAIIFDCDGVLVDSEVLAQEVELEMLGAAGLVYGRAEFRERFMGMSDKAFLKALDEDALARLGRPIMAELAEPIRARYWEAYVARLTEVPGALACVARLASQGGGELEHRSRPEPQARDDRAAARISRRTSIRRSMSPMPSPRPICSCMPRPAWEFRRARAW